MLKRILEGVFGCVLVLSALYWLGGGIPMKAGIPMSSAPLAKVVCSLSALAEFFIGLFIVGHALGMGNAKIVVKNFILAIVLALLLAGISVVHAEEKSFDLLYLGKNGDEIMFQVTATKPDTIRDSHENYVGYGNAIAQAIKQIAKNRVIKSVVPIVYVENYNSHYAAGVTKQVIIFAIPREEPKK